MDRNELASNYSRNNRKILRLAIAMTQWPKDNKVSCVEIVMACCRSEAGSSFRNQPPKRLADSYYWSLSSEWNLLSFIFNKMREDPHTKKKRWQIVNIQQQTTYQHHDFPPFSAVSMVICKPSSGMGMITEGDASIPPSALRSVHCWNLKSKYPKVYHHTIILPGFPKINSDKYGLLIKGKLKRSWNHKLRATMLTWYERNI